jgi:hypothetical protein
MKTNDTTRKTATKKAPLKTKVVAVEPFAAVAAAEPAKKRVKKNAVANAKKVAMTAKAEAVPVKKTVRKTAKSIVLDPFAEVAVAPPVKKRVAKSVKAEATPPKKAVRKSTRIAIPDVTAEVAGVPQPVELSPSFKALAEPTLPALARENRARLQMQTPTRLYFYWSIRENPWHLLRSAFGDDVGSYTLVVKLIDKDHGYEVIRQTEAEGNWWFDVEPNRTYQAEIGFYAPNRPYFRILYSNTVETPRRSPSPRAATESDWTVSANKFAEVLDVAGFSRDAFDVAMAGDDYAAAENTTHTAFSRFIGSGDLELHGIAAEDIRHAMLALASGRTLEELRWKISATLFAILQANAGKLEANKAMSALAEHFDVDEAEFVEERFGPAVYGASLLNFPRTLKTRAVSAKYAPRYSPVSSHSLR